MKKAFVKVHGYTPDISEYLTFQCYDWVWFHEPNNPENRNLVDGLDQQLTIWDKV
jgi:hypothetical protein